MSKDKPNAEQQEKKSFQGKIVSNFEYKKKKYFSGSVFKTENEDVFNHLLTTKRIIE